MGLSVIIFAGCRPEGSTLSPEAQTTPIASPADTVGSPSPAPVVSPDQGNPATVIAQGIVQGSSCVTASYFADVVPEGGQLLMSFVRKPSIASLNQASATRTVNADGSVTFAAGRENIFYMRVFPDETCFVQTVSANGAIGVEENGRTRNSIQSVVQPTPAPIIPGQIRPPVVDPPGPITRPPVIDPPGPITRPPVIDPPGPITRPPVVDPPGPNVRPPVTDPPRPTTRPAISSSPSPSPPIQSRPAVTNPPSPTSNPLAR